MADTTKKDTIYIDIDDEITAVIDKVRASDAKIVALVLPKRATVLQSVVNMKLLKRSADQSKKHIVLITSEAGLLPLAATAGLYVAKNLQSKPEIPASSEVQEDTVEDLDPDAEGGDFNAETAGDRPVGALAAAAGTPVAAAGAADAIETLELDNETDAKPDKPDGAGNASGSVADAKPVKLKKDHKLAVPNFNRFRLSLVLAGLLLVVLLAGIYMANVVLPKASIAISTDTSDVNSNLSLTLDTAAKALDAAKLVVPAVAQTSQKNGSQQVATTGQKNIGTTATGTVTMSAGACAGTVPADVSAGTGISSGGLTFITQQDANFGTTISKGHCTFESSAIPISSQNPGTKYNLNNATFTVAGRSDVSGTGTTSGGTDNIVQVVAQADIDGATQKITTQNGDSVKQDLQTKIHQAGLYPIVSTFVAGTPTVTKSANVGDQASTLTVTQSTTYTMFGAKEADLKTLVDNDVKDKIDPSKQSILTEGLDNATWRVNSASATTAQLALTTTATAGPDLKTDTIKQEVAGKKSGEIQSMLKSDPGVSDVQVHMSPFWVTHAPSKPAKITVTFVKSKP